MGEDKPKSRRGFASMSPERRREIQSKGGKRVQELGLANRWNSAGAAVAGRKGGLAVSADKAHMAELGRRGRKARAAKQEQLAACEAPKPCGECEEE